MLPDASVATHNIVVFPSGNVFDALLVNVTGWRSTAVGLFNWTVLLSSDVASTVMLTGFEILGGVVLTTSII